MQCDPVTLPMLSQATTALRSAILNCASTVVVEAGEMLFNVGDPGDALYVVDTGAIEIGVVSPDGQKYALSVMAEGDVFGEIALFDGSPRTAAATALRQSRLRRIHRSDVLNSIQAKPELALDLIQLMCVRLRWMHGLMEDEAFLPLPVRLAKRLMVLASRIGGEDGAVRISQSGLAEFVGATREGVGKILVAWRSRGWIALSRNRIEILDLKALESVAAALDA